MITFFCYSRMRDTVIAPRGVPSSCSGRPCPTGRPTRWASAAPDVNGCWERGPPVNRRLSRHPRHIRRHLPKAPPVVNLSITQDSSAPCGQERSYSAPVRSHARSAGSRGRGKSSSAQARYRRRAASARWEADTVDDNRSVCTTASLLSHARSDSAVLNPNPPSSPPWAGARGGKGHRPPGLSKDIQGQKPSSSAYPKGYAKVQEMVRRLRDSRTPLASSHLQHTQRSSGLCQLSIQGRKDTIDPVLAWSNLTQSERDWPPQAHPYYPGDPAGEEEGGPDFTLATTTSESADELTVSDDEGIVSGCEEGDEEDGTMETMSIPPFANNPNNPLGEEEEEMFRYSSHYNYDRRTGQILNYYVEKEDGSPGNGEGLYDRHERCQQKASRSVPSQASLYRPSQTYPQHWRSSTIPPPPKTAGQSDRASVTGRVFMGKRIHPPPKIEPAYRPKPLQRRGKSFVQIHRPMTLMPRSQTADYVLRTCSVMSNSTDEDSAEEYDVKHAHPSLDRDMSNMCIVGKSLQTKGGRTKKARAPPPLFSSVQGGGGSSSRYFPGPVQEVQTQMQTISPPHSSQTSSYLTSTAGSSRVTTSAAPLDDLYVVNHVNPSPRQTARHHHVSVYDVTSGVTSEADIKSSESIKKDGETPDRSMLLSETNVSGVISAVILENAAFDDEDDETYSQDEELCDPQTAISGELLAPCGEQADSGVGLDGAGDADCPDDLLPTHGQREHHDEYSDDASDNGVEDDGKEEVEEDIDREEGEVADVV